MVPEEVMELAQMICDREWSGLDDDDQEFYIKAAFRVWMAGYRKPEAA